MAMMLVKQRPDIVVINYSLSWPIFFGLIPAFFIFDRIMEGKLTMATIWLALALWALIYVFLQLLYIRVTVSSETIIKSRPWSFYLKPVLVRREEIDLIEIQRHKPYRGDPWLSVTLQNGKKVYYYLSSNSLMELENTLLRFGYQVRRLRKGVRD
jgi:hypothetical protein